MKQQKIILFVCTENSARSQMAEGFFNFYNKNSEFIGMSAGTNPSKDIKLDAIKVMKEKGIDISKQKPKMLDLKTAQKAYRIYTMGCIKGCPITPKEKTIEWNFDDPTGKSTDDYRKVSDKIETKIKELIGKLKNAD